MEQNDNEAIHYCINSNRILKFFLGGGSTWFSGILIARSCTLLQVMLYINSSLHVLRMMIDPSQFLLSLTEYSSTGKN